MLTFGIFGALLGNELEYQWRGRRQETPNDDPPIQHRREPNEADEEGNPPEREEGQSDEEVAYAAVIGTADIGSYRATDGQSYEISEGVMLSLPSRDADALLEADAVQRLENSEGVSPPEQENRRPGSHGEGAEASSGKTDEPKNEQEQERKRERDFRTILSEAEEIGYDDPEEAFPEVSDVGTAFELLAKSEVRNEEHLLELLRGLAVEAPEKIAAHPIEIGMVLERRPELREDVFEILYQVSERRPSEIPPSVIETALEVGLREYIEKRTEVKRR